MMSNHDGVPSAPGRTETKVRWRCDICKVAAFDDFNEACRHEEECLQKQQEEEEGRKKRQKKATATHPFFTKPLQNSKSEPMVANARKKSASTKSSSTQSTTIKAPLAAIFQKSTKPAQAESEGEPMGQRKRQAATSLQINTTKQSRAAKTIVAREEKGGFTCPRFPLSSYIPCPVGKRERYMEGCAPLLDTEQLRKAGIALRHAGVSMEWELDASPATMTEYLTDAVVPDETMFDEPYIQGELAKLLVCTESNSVEPGLWVDKYFQNLEDICGSQNKSAAQELVSWVREWMAKRQQANERMAERQAALKQQSKKKKKKSFLCDDEDLWTDDEEEGLGSICLVEGPVGSCKSSLVHAVARHCNCQVLELNTSDERGSVSLKNALEEATQSHSSVAMLQKKGLFAKPGPFEKNGDCERRDQTTSSLSIILIDEGKNMCANVSLKTQELRLNTFCSRSGHHL